MWPATTLTTLMGSDGRGIGGIEGAERLDGKLGVLTVAWLKVRKARADVLERKSCRTGARTCEMITWSETWVKLQVASS